MSFSKLELTWIGKENRVNIEPRILLELEELSNVKYDKNTENILIQGDNLLALKALEQKYTGIIKCIYIDPPYNTGTAFEHYDDNLEHSIWLSLMRERLEGLKKLLSEDGIIFVQIDDNEQAYLKVLMDEIYGRSNFLNMITVKMKNIAGASGGGEDKRLKKNVEYILAYTKNNDKFNWVNNAYSYTEIFELVNSYKTEGISWKYTSIMYEPGDKEYFCSTVDGSGDEIKIYKRNNPIFLSISQVAKKEGITEKEVYYKYIDRIHTTAMPQSSIRPRVMEKLDEMGYTNDGLISIEYVPISGKNKGSIYEQFYKGDKYRLVTWLRDVVEVRSDEIVKKDLQGTYWDGINLNNLTKEGNVIFANGKKPEALISRIIDMSTREGDLVLDSFLGSGTTAAVAHKMKRKWIGIEMGTQAHEIAKVRLDRVIEGSDDGGITKDVSWEGGGGYKYYKLAATLIKTDKFDQPVINNTYNAEMLASAVAKHEGYFYKPDETHYWKQSTNESGSYLFVTTRHVDKTIIDSIKTELKDDEFLIIVCKSFSDNAIDYVKNIAIKKIPQSLLKNCEFDVDNYNLNIINPPVYDYEEEDDVE
ncbi:site-specific DNA-methyltransferase [Acholeplasma laidlawii]|uniref:site-specific DNA-methyltransferase n=1 Tax=Acholeplasma laidlawii TaxID=2148 RepID=UPI0021F7EA42|nr:site-specific DNA-methyltransferase [Acholeplasma laidlawii]